MIYCDNNLDGFGSTMKIVSIQSSPSRAPPSIEGYGMVAYSFMFSVVQILALVLLLSAASSISALSSDALFQKNRPEILNLLNHPLQLQLATGDLALGAFQRLILDRKAILEGLDAATGGLMDQEVALHDKMASSWLATAEQACKTIEAEGVACYNCGGNHLNIDCPRDQQVSSSAQALKSLLVSHGLPGALAVLRLRKK